MANVVRDPREHPDAIIPDLATNSIAKFSKDDVALVYGSVWKQRYFTKRGDDYFPEPAQWALVFDTVQCSLYSLQPEAYWKLGCFGGVSCTTSIWCATFARQ